MEKRCVFGVATNLNNFDKMQQNMNIGFNCLPRQHMGRITKTESGPKLGPDQVPTKSRPSSPGPEVTAPRAESGPKLGPDQVPTKLAGARGNRAEGRG